MKMKPLSLGKIAEVTGGTYVGEESLREETITGVVRDNREVLPGNLFVCIVGAKVDGHTFAPAAYASGAACCLVEKELTSPAGPYIQVDNSFSALAALAAYYRTLFDIPFIGITGSVGKTTAKEMISSVLAERYSVLKTIKNLNNELGVPLTLLSLREEHEVAVIEMGISDFGEMSRLAAMVRPDVCVMTTIGYCHLENLGDLNGVLRAKSEVFASMPRDGVAVVCGDDELLRAFDPGIRKVQYGREAHNDFRAEDVVSHGFEGLTCTLVHGEERFKARIPAFGSHLVLAALAAAAVGHICGLTSDQIRSGLMSYMPVGGRANIVKTSYLTIIDDCYNANPNSVAASVLSLSALSGRRVAILGDMKELGTSELEYHREIGVLCAEKQLDCLICCGDMARSIYSGAKDAGKTHGLFYYADKEALMKDLSLLIEADDTVLVKASHSMGFEKLVDALKELS